MPVEPPVEAVSPHPPPPPRPVSMNQDWRDLLFLHWAVDPDRVARRMPPGVRPDVHEGVTYVGLVPFRMVDAGPGRRSSVPWLGTFLETNVRLYSVDRYGRRGVVFCSLDTDRLLVVLGARLAFNVPYRWGRMRHEARLDASGAVVHRYRAALRRPSGPATSDVEVRVGARREPTDLDHFVSARWRLHTTLAGRPVLVPNTHDAWRLHDVEVLRLDDQLLGSVGFGDLADRKPDHAAFSPGVHAVFGLPRGAGAAAGETLRTGAARSG